MSIVFLGGSNYDYHFIIKEFANIAKYEPDKTPYLDTFHAVLVL